MASCLLRAGKRQRMSIQSFVEQLSSSDDDDDVEDAADQDYNPTTREPPMPWVWNVSGVQPGSLFVTHAFPMRGCKDQQHSSLDTGKGQQAKQRRDSEQLTPRKRACGGAETFTGGREALTQPATAVDEQEGGVCTPKRGAATGLTVSVPDQQQEDDVFLSPSFIAATPVAADCPSAVPSLVAGPAELPTAASADNSHPVETPYSSPVGPGPSAFGPSAEGGVPQPGCAPGDPASATFTSACAQAAVGHTALEAAVSCEGWPESAPLPGGKADVQGLPGTQPPSPAGTLPASPHQQRPIEQAHNVSNAPDACSTGSERAGTHSQAAAHGRTGIAVAPAYVAVAEAANAGHRSYMEDRTAVTEVDGVCYVGVYDGHGGCDASTYLQAHLIANIRNRLSPGADVANALAQAYTETNESFRSTGSVQGSTATTVVLHGTQLVAANVGDSPAFVLTNSGHVYCTFQEHKIEGLELARVSGYGVPILHNPAGPTYMGTADGTRWLNMSRAFGDFIYPAVVCEPFVCSLDIRDAQYMVLGSDGLTERWPVAEVARFVQQVVREGETATAAAAGLGGSSGGSTAGSIVSPAMLARALVQRALQRGSTDNVSAVVVDLQAYLCATGVMQGSDDDALPSAAPAGDMRWAQPPQQTGAAAAALPAAVPAAVPWTLPVAVPGVRRAIDVAARVRAAMDVFRCRAQHTQANGSAAATAAGATGTKGIAASCAEPSFDIDVNDDDDDDDCTMDDDGNICVRLGETGKAVPGAAHTSRDGQPLHQLLHQQPKAQVSGVSEHVSALRPALCGGRAVAAAGVTTARWTVTTGATMAAATGSARGTCTEVDGSRDSSSGSGEDNAAAAGAGAGAGKDGKEAAAGRTHRGQLPGWLRAGLDHACPHGAADGNDHYVNVDDDVDKVDAALPPALPLQQLQEAQGQLGAPQQLQEGETGDMVQGSAAADAAPAGSSLGRPPPSDPHPWTSLQQPAPGEQPAAPAQGDEDDEGDAAVQAGVESMHVRSPATGGAEGSGGNGIGDDGQQGANGNGGDDDDDAEELCATPMTGVAC